MRTNVIIGIILMVMFGASYGSCEDIKSLRQELDEVKRQLNELKKAGRTVTNGAPKLDINGESYVLQRRGNVQLVLVTKGTVKNSGTGDANNVVITTDCPECSMVGRNGAWMDASVILKSRKGTVINHLAAGESKDFSYPAAMRVAPVSFAGIMKSAPHRPAGLKTRVVSFDAVRK
jgi:hypothetical protein